MLTYDIVYHFVFDLGEWDKIQAEHCLGQLWGKLSTVWNSSEPSWAVSGTALSQAKHCLGQLWAKLSTVWDSSEPSWERFWDCSEPSWALSGTALSQAERGSDSAESNLSAILFIYFKNLFYKVVSEQFCFKMYSKITNGQYTKNCNALIKGQANKIFEFQYFPNSNLLGPMDKKTIWCWIKIRPVIQIFQSPRRVKSTKHDSPVYYNPGSQSF